MIFLSFEYDLSGDDDDDNEFSDSAFMQTYLSICHKVNFYTGSMESIM